MDHAAAPPAAGTPPRPRFPAWLRKPLAIGPGRDMVVSCIARSGLHTVCVEAKCPNRAECFTAGTATFLILGDRCTRQCAFCGVGKGAPEQVDKEEPRRLAQAAADMGLRHIVITSVTRDDLPDGGAAHFAACVKECRDRLAGATIELLIPDFGGDEGALDTVLAARPDVLNHNVETVPRLYGQIRPRAAYRRSLDIIARASQRVSLAKSGLMVGLGETANEVHGVLSDLAAAGCSIVTIGQYLQPSRHQVTVARFETPETFAAYEKAGKAFGLSRVVAGPFVRSSWRAGDLLPHPTSPQTGMV